MALSATLAELETWIRQDADMQAPDDRVTSEECRNRINRSLAQLYDRLVLVDQEYFLKGVTVASNGSGKYDIMNDFATGVARSITSVLAAGTGYTNGATVTLSQGANATATGIVSASGGSITGITLTSGGFGYVDAPLASPAWNLVNTVAYPSAFFFGQPIIIGGGAYYTAQQVTGSDNFVCRVDLVTGAITMTALMPATVRPCMGYDASTNRLLVALSDGSISVVDPNTMTFTNAVPFVASLTFNGLFFDAPNLGAYTASSSDLIELDNTGGYMGNYPPGVVIDRILAIRRTGGQSYLIYQDATPSNNIRQINIPGLTSDTVLTAAPTTAASAVYAPTSDKLVIQFVNGDLYEYDYGSSTFTNITSTVTAVPGYVKGPSLMTYDSSTDRIWLGSWLPSTTSTTVIALLGATLAVDEYFTTPSPANLSIGAFNGGVIVVGYPFLSGPPDPPSFYIYNYGSVLQSIPNYIALNVSGGSGGQVLAYIESDFYKCKGVWFTDGSGTEPDNGNWYPLRRFSWEQQNALNQSALYDGLRALPLYRIVTEGTRDKLVISPDQLSGSYKLWYYPAPPRLLTATDRFDGRAGWDEWIVKDVAIQLLMAEESIEQAATLKNVRDEIWQRIQLHAEDREAAQPQRIMDATLLSRRYGPRWGR